MPMYYILTQLPLANTIGDFWQMVVGEEIVSIAMLDRICRDNQVGQIAEYRFSEVLIEPSLAEAGFHAKHGIEE